MFDHKMKLAKRHLHKLPGVIAVLLLLAAGLWVRANVVAVGRLQSVFPGAEKRHLIHEVTRADLIVQGTVINVNTSLWASRYQIEVGYPQGWTVAHICPSTVFKGHCGTNVIVTPAGWWPGAGRGNSFIKPFTNGQEFIFFLDRDWNLSRWCYANVFRHDNVISLNKDDRTTKSTLSSEAAPSSASDEK
jgi:hypothetical protein